jgi:SAM-dependent methyltransferase
MSTEAQTEPEFSSYGKFRETELFANLFGGNDKFDRRQRIAARTIVERILLHRDGQLFPVIDTVVDIGCGDGSLLAEISLAWSESQDTTSDSAHCPGGRGELRCIGIDSCIEMIQIAQKIARPEVGDLEFFTYAEDANTRTLNKPLSQVATIATGLDWSRTALCVLGHTWFHMLDQDALLDEINKHRPALLLVDVFDTWDDIIGSLSRERLSALDSSVEQKPINSGDADSAPSTSPFIKDEDFRPVHDRLYSLRTELIDDGAMVYRGIYEHAFKGQGQSRWIFRTKQVAKTSDALRLTSAGRPQTGDFVLATEAESLSHKLNYLVLHEFSHESGWGRMRCVALAKLSDEAAKWNDMYFSAVKGLTDYLFISTSDVSVPAIKNLRNLISDFQGGELAAILPFDCLRAFARMLPLFPQQRGTSEQTNVIELTPIILEYPNKYQDRFPTAYGLFHTMLSPASSPIALPLTAIPTYRKNLLDVNFECLEGNFLGKSGDELASSYFIVPIYFGLLPLFAVIVGPPKRFPPESTSPQVYSVLAMNLERQLRVVLDENTLRSRLIRPFLTNLWLSINEDVDKTGDRAVRFQDIIDQLQIAITLKPWKSWLQALPSMVLRNMEGVKNENNRLKEIIRTEVDIVSNDGFLAVSLALKDVRFFYRPHDLSSVDPHEEFVPQVHCDRVIKLQERYPPTAPPLRQLATTRLLLDRLKDSGEFATCSGTHGKLEYCDQSGCRKRKEFQSLFLTLKRAYEIELDKSTCFMFSRTFFRAFERADFGNVSEGDGVLKIAPWLEEQMSLIHAFEDKLCKHPDYRRARHLIRSIVRDGHDDVVSENIAKVIRIMKSVFEITGASVKLGELQQVGDVEPSMSVGVGFCLALKNGFDPKQWEGTTSSGCLTVLKECLATAAPTGISDLKSWTNVTFVVRSVRRSTDDDVRVSLEIQHSESQIVP